MSKDRVAGLDYEQLMGV